MTHCHKKCVSKYLRNTKKLDESRSGVLEYYTRTERTVRIDLRREDQTWKFLPYAFLMAIGYQNYPQLINKRTVESVEVLSTKT